MDEHWQYRPASYVMPLDAGKIIRDGAPGAEPAFAEGPRRACLLVWRPATNDRARAPIGRIFVRWEVPDGEVMVHRVGWDEPAGGSEAQVWRAVEHLARRAGE